MRFQSNHIKGLISPPRVLNAGNITVARFDFTFAAAFTAASDQLELGILPAFCSVYDAVLIGNSGGAANGSVGLMAGTLGDAAAANGDRAITANLFSAASINGTVTRATLATAFGGIAPSDRDRSIGFSSSADIAAGANNVSLILFYA